MTTIAYLLFIFVSDYKFAKTLFKLSTCHNKAVDVPPALSASVLYNDMRNDAVDKQ